MKFPYRALFFQRDPLRAFFFAPFRTNRRTHFSGCFIPFSRGGLISFWSILLFSLLPTFASGQTITTWFGDGTDSILNAPSGLYITSNYTLIADTGNHRILRIDPFGTATVVAGDGTAGYSGDNSAATSAQLNSPTSVFADKNDIIYIADTGNHCIRRVASNGIITTIAGDGTAGYSGDNSAATSARLSSPTSVSVDANGNIYIADRDNHRVRKVTGNTIATVAGDGTAGFVGDTTATSARLHSPAALFVHGDGSLYIADRDNQRIRRVDPAGLITTVAGNGTTAFSGDDLPATQATLAFPSAVWVDTVGSIFIADRFNQRVRKIRADSTITTIAGNGEFAFSGDGNLAPSASFKNPTAVFGDSTGNLYIADQGNNRIRLISLLREFTRATGLTGARTAMPGEEIPVFSIGVIGDGFNSVSGLSLSISDLSDTTKLSSRNLSTLKIYRSDDLQIDHSDPLLATLTNIRLEALNTIDFTLTDVPPNLTERFYLATVAWDTVVAEGHAFKVGFPQGGLTTSRGRIGTAVVASDDDRVTMDIVATRLLFSRQPGGSVSGVSLVTQPTLILLDAYGNVDTSFADTVSLTTNGQGTLQNTFALPDSGTVTFTALVYDAVEDDETFTLIANDRPGGAEGDLPEIHSNSLRSNIFNDPPIVEFPSLILDEDETFTAPVAAIVNDPDDSLFTWTYDSNHIDLRVADGQVTLIPQKNWFGSDLIIITVTDAHGASTSDPASIQVRPLEDPPDLTFPSLYSLSEDDTLRLSLREFVSDPEDSLSDLDLTFLPPSGLSHTRTDGDSLEIWAPPDSSGRFDFSLQARDPGGNTALDTFQVVVVPINDPPQLAIPDTVLLQRRPLSLIFSSFTRDPDDPLSALIWSATGDTHIAVTIDTVGRQAVIQPDSSWYGNGQIVFTVADTSGATATDTVQIEVVRVNLPPLLTSLPDTSLAKGDTLVWDLVDFASDPDDSTSILIWSLSGSFQGSGSFIGSVLTFLPSRLPARTDSLIITLGDTLGLTAQSALRITVSNLPPRLLPLPDLELRLDSVVPLSLALYAEDDGALEELTWAVEADSGLSIRLDADDGSLSIEPLADAFGRRTMVVTVADAEGVSAADSLQISILGAGGTPFRLHPLPPLAVEVGQTFDALLLGDFVELLSPEVEPPTWEVDAGSYVEATILPAGVLRLSGVSPGVDSLVVTARHIGGTTQSAIAVVSVADTSVNTSDPSDFDGSGQVDFDDFFRFADAFGITSAEPGWDPVFDLDGSGQVDFDDFFRFADTFVYSQPAILVRLVDIPDLSLTVGGSTSLMLDDFLLVGVPAQVTWAATFSDLVQVVIDPLSHLATISALKTGQGELSFTASTATGGQDSDTLQISILSAPTVSFQVDLPETITLRRGHSTALNLDSYVSQVDFPLEEMVWTATFSDLVQVVIDPLSHLATISALKTGQGKLSFTASTATGGQDSDTLQISILSAPTASFRVDLPETITLRRGRSTALNLDSYVSQVDFPLEEMVWTAATTEGIEVSIRDRSAFIAAALDAPDGGQVIFTARSPAGEEAESVVQINVP
jgi:hypothetical protein